MKEKRMCQIVQDLLPNYVEKLTNEETNLFVEEHVKTCSECKNKLENMQKEFNLNVPKMDNKEVNYIKKYSKKLKMLRNTLLIIIVVYLIVVGRKAIILKDIMDKEKELIKMNNYYSRVESYGEDGRIMKLESYYKDERFLGTVKIYTKDGNVMNEISYKSGDEKISLIDKGDKKILSRPSDIAVGNPEGFPFNTAFELAKFSSIDKVTLNGKKCYLIKDKEKEQFMDVNTGMPLKIIENRTNTTINYEYKFGIVQDSDIVRPDTTGYVER